MRVPVQFETGLSTWDGKAILTGDWIADKDGKANYAMIENGVAGELSVSSEPVSIAMRIDDDSPSFLASSKWQDRYKPNQLRSKRLVLIRRWRS